MNSINARDEITRGTAADLRRGDVVLNLDGTRRFGAFDVDPGQEMVTAWTSLGDQDRGEPEYVTMPADTPLIISRWIVSD